MDRRVRRGAALVLGVYAAVVVVVLLSPISPEVAVAWLTALLRDDVGWSAVRQGWVEFALNIALFVPLGLLVTMLFRRVWLGVVTALLLSVAAEAVQEFLPGRLASLRDVLANVVGAAIGAFIAWIILRRLRGRAASPSDKP
ncbi:VanZ family protein [Microbacterium sp. NPDC091313]